MSIFPYTIQSIANILHAKVLKSSENTIIRHILLDSRKLSSPENSIFFALKGARNDGHKYIQDLYKKGIRNFVISEELIDTASLIDCNFLKVENTLLSLQQLARYHREQFTIPVIGVTGSNGKTIIKEWLFQLLREDKNIVRSPKSYNSQIGVALSVWQILPEHTLGIFEAGISRMGEMAHLEPAAA